MFTQNWSPGISGMGTLATSSRGSVAATKGIEDRKTHDTDAKHQKSVGQGVEYGGSFNHGKRLHRIVNFALHEAELEHGDGNDQDHEHHGLGRG
jgi:hypothetical protein